MSPLQAYDSPLAVTLAAGAVALPPLLKLLGVMEKGGRDLRTCGGQLPLEIELGAEFVYHSIFACPVGRDQSTPGGVVGFVGCWSSGGAGRGGRRGGEGGARVSCRVSHVV